MTLRIDNRRFIPQNYETLVKETRRRRYVAVPEDYVTWLVGWTTLAGEAGLATNLFALLMLLGPLVPM